MKTFNTTFSTGVIKYSKFIIYGLLVLVSILLFVNNWQEVYYGGITAWHALVPAIVFLWGENAVKLWGVKRFGGKIACYVFDVLALIVLTVFSNGALISTLYIVILTEFYLTQEKISADIAMGAASLVLFLVSFAVSSTVRNINFNVVSFVTTMFNDLVIIILHFFIVNFTVQIYRKNLEVTKALEELDASNAKLQAAYRELREVAALEERQRIAKDIHDTAGHSITTVIMQTEAARLVIDADPEDAKRKIAAANLQAKHALDELRENVHLLSGASSAPTLRDSLLSIIHDSTDGTNIAVRYDIDDLDVCDAKRRFFSNVLKEGISNGLRHGNATAFYVELKREDPSIRFLLSDNGEGLDLASLKEGFGLKGMHARAEALGGDVWFVTEKGEGFEIHITMPLDGDKGGSV